MVLFIACGGGVSSASAFFLNLKTTYHMDELNVEFQCSVCDGDSYKVVKRWRDDDGNVECELRECQNCYNQQYDSWDD